MKYVPGKEFKATPTPTGHVPVYKANGVQCYVISIIALFALKYYNIFNPSDVFDLLGQLFGSIVIAALVFCSILYYKGLNYPSTKDSGTNGSLIVDFFWGTELYPRIFGFDVKQFTNCRFGMMYWQLGILCYAFKQYDYYGYVSSSMLISVIVQTSYIAKFFYWETGYFCSMDIQHDRAGYYICWGCLCWVPSVYTLHTIYLVKHPMTPSPLQTTLLIFCGLLCVWINYDCDRQRQIFRQTGGKEKIWGKDPEYIVAKYTTKDGEERTNLLLTSGWWGLSRHIHYIPEILASVFWCVPIHTENLIIPYFYPIYLTALLFDRAWRDDARCHDKYGKAWEEYCRRVPEKVIPGVI
jgi:7-dehydrocholesterol reductase